MRLAEAGGGALSKMARGAALMAGGASGFAALRVLSCLYRWICHEIFFAQDIFLIFQDIFCDTASLSRFCHAFVTPVSRLGCRDGWGQLQVREMLQEL